jgi:RHS repeat-associated protein
MSPQGVYNQSSNPPESWAAAPAPSQIQVVAGSGGDPDRIILRWADNDIKNRWLRVTIKSTEDTGLFNDEIFYAGHLLGETTGASGGTYTVAFADQTPIRNAVGQPATVSSILDINKDGVITFSDVSAVAPNIGIQQENITTAVNPLADLTRSQSWNLDALGNFESLTNNDGSAVTRTHNLQNQVTEVGSASLSFDADGNMTEDEQGRIFIWDAWNRLVEVKQGSTTLVEYRYDGLKRRITEDDGTTEKHLYYSHQWKVLEERVGGNAVTQYVWSPVYVDAMILRDRDADADSGNGLEERIYVLHDANFNVTAITDASGTVLERYAYEAYGRPIYLDADFDFQPDAQSDHSWQHLHQGGRLDQATGNYHFRHRDLSPGIGRWLSQDPIGFEAGDANLYRYVGNGPGNRVDPSGLAVETIWDVGNIAIGAGSLGYNIYHGNWWDATVDAGGLVLDTVATLVPFLPGGAGMAIKAGRYGDDVADLVGQAQKLYPKKAGKIENHHIDPKYLGGDPNGPTVPLDASYHQLITNEFRDLQQYGTGPVSPERLQELKDLVYEKYPIPK